MTKCVVLIPKWRNLAILVESTPSIFLCRMRTKADIVFLSMFILPQM